MILQINLPENSKCLLKSGQIVDFNTPFLENTVTKEIVIQVAKKTGTPPDKIFNYLKKFVGDTVEKNDLLAIKKTLMGNIKITAPQRGTIKEIDHQSGQIILSAVTSQTGDLNAYFKGEVVEVDKKFIKLKVAAVHEFILKFASADFGGETFYLRNESESVFARELTGKIMISENITPYLFAKSEALGVNGFISLKNPPLESAIAKAQIKSIEDFKKILHLNLPYCFIDKQYSKIYFYK